MSTLTDNNGKNWQVELDAFTLGDLRDELEIQLEADGLYQLEQSEEKLVKALAVICREALGETTPRQFARGFSGEALTRALEAVREAAAHFFPKKRWSEMQSYLKTRRENAAMFAKARPTLATLADPEVPEAIRQPALEMLAEIIQGSVSIGSQQSEAGLSVFGLEETPPTAATGSPGSSESAPAV